MTPTHARTAHGTAAEGGALLVTETTPINERQKAAAPAPPIARANDGTVRDSEAARRLAQFPRRRARVPQEGRAYRRARGVELERAHGRVPDGVAVMLDAEACAWLAGSKAAFRAAETGDREDIAAMTKAFDLARALAKDAWALCAFEAEATKTARTTGSFGTLRDRVLGGGK